MLLAGCCFRAAAQTTGGDAIDHVDVGALSQATISTTAFPFDIPFDITGDIPDNCYRRAFSYKINDPKAFVGNTQTLHHRVTFPGIPEPDWVNAGSAKKFVLHCSGIHPNIKYVFKFTIYRRLTLVDPLKTDLKTAIAKSITNYFQIVAGRTYAAADLALVNATIQTAFQQKYAVAYPTQKLTNPAGLGQPYQFTITQANLVNTFNSYMHSGNEINTSTQNLTGMPNGDEAAFLAAFKAIKDNLVTMINQFHDSGTVLTATPATPDYLKQVVCPSYDDFKTYTLLQGIDILRQFAANPDYFQGLIDGKLRITNGSVVAATARDVPSIVFMSDLIDFLNTGYIQFKDGGPILNFKTLLSDNLTQIFHNIRQEISNIDAQTTLQKSLLANIPDDILQVVSSEAIAADAELNADVNTQNSPYFSVEGGVGYAGDFNKWFSYYQANIYFWPVNKKARLSDLPCDYRWRKQLSLNIGIANFFGQRPVNTSSFISSTGSSDLFVGAGWRLNRFLKINIDYLLYNTDNFNTLAQSPRTEGTFVATIGIDINLIKGFTNIGKALNIVN